MTTPTSQSFTSLIRGDLCRIANALEHLAYPQVMHTSGQCEICTQKKKIGSGRKIRSTVLSPAQLIKREQEIRTQRMLHGPEEPVHDMFRYRELNPKG